MSDLPIPQSVSAGTSRVLLRRAEPDDLEALIRLLSDDPISAGRGDVADPADRARYADALARIGDDPGNDVVVALDESGAIVGTFQLTRIPGMSRRGSTRLLIEAVRVATSSRSAGIGSAMMRWVLDDAARALNVALVQLTSDAARPDAHRFYTRLGFVDSHVGFKYAVERA